MRNLLTGLDVGTSKVCAIVGESLPDGQLATLGFGVSPCTGLRKGVVVNIEATVEAIRMAVAEAEKSSGARMGVAVVGVAGAHIRGLNSHGIVAVRGGEVSGRDVERVIDAALPGHPTALESDLLSYRRLPSSEGHGKLFELTAQHPNARVLRGWMPPIPRAQPKRR